jgi:hypothetical protein
LQLQFWIVKDLAGEFMFCGQLISRPSTQYLDALHGWHAETPLPYVPLRHRQKSAEGDCGGELCADPCGQL